MNPRPPSPRALLALLGVACAATAIQAVSFAEPAPLLPRQTLLRDAERSAPVLSPQGNAIAWIAPTNGLLNLWIRSVATNDTRLASLDPRGSVRQPVWQGDGAAVLYLQEGDAFGNLHLMQTHVASGNIRDLTPFVGVQARPVAVSSRTPGEILVALNLRNRRVADVFRIDVHSGALAIEDENSGEITAWYADDDLNLRLAQLVLPGGELALATRPDAKSMWRPILRWGSEDALGKIVGFGPGGSTVLLVSSIRAPAPRLLEINLATGNTGIIAQDPRADVSAVLIHPTSNTVDAVQFVHARNQWQLGNTNLLPDFEALRRFRNADIDVLGRDTADRHWCVSYTSDNAPVQYAVYDRVNRQVTPLYSEHPALEDAQLASVRPVQFKARDGLPLEGYLTLPAGLDPKGLPAVVLVHGGPWARAVWGLDHEAQWLANRGYAVIEINYRGSTGYGKDHLNAGDREWGGRILEDLLDARQWTIDQGFADPKRVAILGTGFGGYAALEMLASHPQSFAAGVSLSGPINLVSMIQSVPATVPMVRTVLEKRVGNPATESDRLLAQSPVSRASRIKAPLLAAAGGRDSQIPVSEMDQFVATVRRDGGRVEYLHFPDEGGQLREPANRFRFYAAVEAFLGKYLGGRIEPPAEFEKFDTLRR